VFDGITQMYVLFCMLKKKDWNTSVAGHKQGTVGCPQVNRKGKGKVQPRTAHEVPKGE